MTSNTYFRKQKYKKTKRKDDALKTITLTMADQGRSDFM